MKKADKAQKAELESEVYAYFLASGKDCNCMKNFEDITKNKALEMTREAIENGYKFSNSRFNPLDHSVFSVINGAYSLYIKEFYS